MWVGHECVYFRNHSNHMTMWSAEVVMAQSKYSESISESISSSVSQPESSSSVVPRSDDSDDERAFSILSNSFANRQEHSLKDYIETSVMLQCNSSD